MPHFHYVARDYYRIVDLRLEAVGTAVPEPPTASAELARFEVIRRTPPSAPIYFECGQIATVNAADEMVGVNSPCTPTTLRRSAAAVSS